MRKSSIRILLTGMTLAAGTLMVAGPAAALPGPGYDPPFDDIEIFEPCWLQPQGCVADPVDPVDPPADPPADPQPEPEQPGDPGSPAEPANPGNGGSQTGDSSQTGDRSQTGDSTETVEPTASTEAVPVAEQAAANKESSDSSAMPLIAFGVLGAGLTALAVVAVLRLRGRALR